MNIEIIFADEKQCYREMKEVSENCTVHEALTLFTIQKDWQKESIGIFGQKVSLSTCLKSNDRLEIYRPLLIDPMEKRRLLAQRRK